MIRLLICGSVLGSVIAVWLIASGMSIRWTSDVNVHVTPYRKHCDGVVQRFLGAKEHARMNAIVYQEMLSELSACNQVPASPTVH